jgi:hypothetical protein
MNLVQRPVIISVDDFLKYIVVVMERKPEVPNAAFRQLPFCPFYHPEVPHFRPLHFIQAV